MQKAAEAAFNHTKPKQSKTQYTPQEPQTASQPRRLPWYKPVPAQSSGEEPYYVDTGKGQGGPGKGGKGPKGGKGGKQFQPFKGKNAKTKAAKAIQSRQDKKQVKTE